MPALERAGDRAALDAARAIATVGREIRVARIGFGLSQRQVARAAGISQSQLSRFERGRGSVPPYERIARVCAAVGLDLSVRVFPAGPPIRDAAQVDLLKRLRQVAAPSIRWSNEVPIPIVGDRRAWDSVGRLQASNNRLDIHVDAESRLHDVQAVLRRVTLKKRDSAAQRVILLVRDSRSNRAAIRASRVLLEEQFPVPGAAAIAALRAGVDPGGDALVLL